MSIALLICAPNAQAGILSSILKFDGSQNVLEDESRDFFVDFDLDTPTLGDVFFGVAVIDDISQIVGQTETPLGAPESVVVAIAAEVTNVTGTLDINGDGELTVEFGAVTQDGFFLNDIIGNGFGRFADDDGTMFAILEKPIDVSASSFTNAGFPTPLSQLDDWTYVAHGGFADGTNAFGDVDFFEAVIEFDENAVDDGDQFGGFTVFDHTFGPGTVFLPSLAPHENIADTSHQVAILDGSLESTDTNGWNVENDVDFGVRVVPEPGSLAIFAFCAGFGFLRRSQRKD